MQKHPKQTPSKENQGASRQRLIGQKDVCNLHACNLREEGEACEAGARELAHAGHKTVDGGHVYMHVMQFLDPIISNCRETDARITHTLEILFSLQHDHSHWSQSGYTKKTPCVRTRMVCSYLNLTLEHHNPENMYVTDCCFSSLQVAMESIRVFRSQLTDDQTKRFEDLMLLLGWSLPSVAGNGGGNGGGSGGGGGSHPDCSGSDPSGKRVRIN